MTVLNLNHTILAGNLVADPEMRVSQSGTNLCRFRIAVNRDHLSADGQRITDFFNCVAWSETAEFVCKNFAKGRPICVVGQLQSGSYPDKNGEKRYYTEISVRRVHMIEPPEAKQPKSNERFTDDLDLYDDPNLPF